MAAVSTLTISQAADGLGVAPARVRSLVASCALPTLGSNLVSADAVTELAGLQAKPVGLFRRRRQAGSPATA